MTNKAITQVPRDPFKRRLRPQGRQKWGDLQVGCLVLSDFDGWMDG